MSAEQLKERCWVLDPDGGPHGDDYSHQTGNEAEALAKFRGRYDPEDHPQLKIRLLPGPCWVVNCDAPAPQEGMCPETLEDDDEGYTIHAETRAEAERAALREDWAVLRDARTFCPDDTPEEIEPDEWAPIWNVPGQMALIGDDAK